MDLKAITDELDAEMLDFWKRTSRLPDPAERPPAPKFQVETKTVSTKHEPQPFSRGTTNRTNNSNANPNNSVRG